MKGSRIPTPRLRVANEARRRPAGRWVLYWMIASRRLDWNFALERAVEWSRETGAPLLILEALRVDYPWASDRLHRFVLDGMSEKARRLASTRVRYLPYVEPEPGAGSGLVERLAEDACVVVTDEYPTFFLPSMVAATASRLRVRLEVIDSNGLLPMAASERAHPTAHSFRRFLQRELPAHLSSFPRPHPLTGDPLPPPADLPASILERWPPRGAAELADPALTAALPIDHDVPPVSYAGGTEAASEVLQDFLDAGFDRYSEERSDPGSDASSGLSPWLHFGHVSAHRIVADVFQREGVAPTAPSTGGDGSRRGWWGLSENAESFLDELVTWRELGYTFCWHRDDHDEFESLPDWALQTLGEHADDRREHLYSLEEFAGAATHDELWNAAQNQLRSDGRIHNYLRMLWGKKILEWSESPLVALDVMIDLNNRYAVDGRDPNSYSGIFWCLGRHDRAWGPERPIFGKVRYMSSENTARKFHVDDYLQRWGTR